MTDLKSACRTPLRPRVVLSKADDLFGAWAGETGFGQPILEAFREGTGRLNAHTYDRGESLMADLVATRTTSLVPEEVLVRAVQFFTNENWRAQSQSNRIATFVGAPKIPWLHLLLAVLLTLCLIIPGLIYYILVIKKARQLQNIVVTTTPKDAGCDVVVSYPPHARKLVDGFFAALS